MRRVVVSVEPANDPGWLVRVRVAAGGADGPDVVAPYRMAAATVGARTVPATPPDRAPAAAQPHAALCGADAGAAGNPALGGLLDRIDRRDPGADDVRNYGRWLFECLLAPAWDAILALPEFATGHALEVALRWAPDCPLHGLAWEAMHDGEAPLAGHPKRLVAITRLVPGPAPDLVTITAVPRVLFVAGSRLTDPVIRPGALYMGLLRALDAGGQCHARALHAATLDDLQRACEAFAPDVVHLVAHGAQTGDGTVLLLRDDAGGTREVDADGLLAAVTAGGHRPAAVVLSACSTGTPVDAAPFAARLVAGGIPVVSAMGGEVSEPACRLYTRRLAVAVHQGVPIGAAAAHGRRAALLGSTSWSGELDWALPSLFVAAGLDPNRQLTDPTQATAVTRLAESLDLRREPVFIGRHEIVTAADRLVQPDAEAGVIAVTSTGPTTGLGGTRLLRELGWRMLRSGHVPLLLGPYPEAQAPRHVRGLASEILQQAVKITEVVGVPPFLPLTVAEHAAGDEPAHPALARRWIRAAIRAFEKAAEPLDLASARDLLAEDLLRLADVVRGWGPPFGTHSRAVLLCDDVHAWGAPGPDSALEALLAMLGRDGLGRTERTVPVVLTASTTAGAGQSVQSWVRQAGIGVRVHSLGELAPDDALLGYQWVLLHPWTTKPAAEHLVYGHVYTPDPRQVPAWEGALSGMPRSPSTVDRDLYLIAKALSDARIARRDDDDDAWRTYAEGLPGGHP